MFGVEAGIMIGILAVNDSTYQVRKILSSNRLPKTSQSFDRMTERQ